MKKTYLFLILPAFLVFLTGCGNKNLTNSQNNTTNNGNAAKANVSLTMADVVQHNSKTDCWQVINGKVYDLSAYIAAGQHPNDKILDGCGKDATSMFEEVAKHNGKATAMLPEYLLGNLQ